MRMTAVRHDLKVASRGLLRARGYALAVTVMIGLGVMAGTVLFTVYKGALIDPWPYDGGERLVIFRGDYPTMQRDDYPLWSAADFAELRELDGVFDHVIAGRGRDVNLDSADGAERVRGAELTPNAFTMLGIRPLHGRLLHSADARADAEPTVLIGYKLWQRRYGGSDVAVGSTLPVDGVQHVIVGVMPPRFLWWGSELWLPLRVDATNLQRDARHFIVQARLRADVDIEQANAVLGTWARRVEQSHVAEYPEYRGWRAQTSLLVDAVLRNVRNVLSVLMVAVALLVLVAGFNVANLLLARAAERRREFAVRAALGATHGRMTGTLLAENLVLAGIGCGLGLLGAYMCIDVVLALIPFSYLPAEANVALDARVAVFSAALALGVAVLAVIPAAMSLRRLRVAGALHEVRATVSKSGVRLRSLFVIAQLALATVVVAGALAVGGSFRERLTLDPGFISAHAVSMRVSLPRDTYPDRPALRRFTLALQQRLHEIPGVEAAGIGITAPLSDGPMYPMSLQSQADAMMASRHEIVAGEWFEALGVPLLAGRVFDERDRAGAQAVAIVNETFVRTFVQGGDPLGLRVRAGAGEDERDWLTIVGVVGDTRIGGVDGTVRPLVYQPVAQSLVQPRSSVVLLRGAAQPASLVGSLRRIVAELDPAVPVHDVATFEEIVIASMGGQRLAVWLLGGFALTVLLLAALGVYGIVSYVTHRAGPEFGLRMALGATSIDIVRLIGRRSLVLGLAGIGIGVMLAAAALRLVDGVMEQPLPSASPVLVLTATLLAVLVATACSGPAVRGARTDPSAALRDE